MKEPSSKINWHADFDRIKGNSGTENDEHPTFVNSECIIFSSVKSNLFKSDESHLSSFLVLSSSNQLLEQGRFQLDFLCPRPGQVSRMLSIWGRKQVWMGIRFSSAKLGTKEISKSQDLRSNWLQFNSLKYVTHYLCS